MKTMLDSSDNKLLAILEDIVNNIQIESNFCIHHPKYQPFCLPTNLAERFEQQIADSLRKKYLKLLLRNFVYGIYFSGFLQNTLTLNTKKVLFQPHQNFETNSLLGIDWQFYQRLHVNNHGNGYYDPGWQILLQEPDGSVGVGKGGITLHIDRKNHLLPSQQSAKIGEYVAIWMPKNRLHNGSYVALSNVGQDKQRNPDGDLGVGRIYLNLNPRGAIVVMDILTRLLNQSEIPFCFKVLYNPIAYGRFDSGILYFEKANYPTIHFVLDRIYQKHQSFFKPYVPFFTKFLASGISVAEEPIQKFAANESFGMNRCQIIANALSEAWHKNHNSPEERMNTIKQHFSKLSIDLRHPYLNPDSEDVYYPLGNG
jgi:hypothetical protein